MSRCHDARRGLTGQTVLLEKMDYLWIGFDDSGEATVNREPIYAWGAMGWFLEDVHGRSSKECPECGARADEGIDEFVPLLLIENELRSLWSSEEIGSNYAYLHVIRASDEIPPREELIAEARKRIDAEKARAEKARQKHLALEAERKARLAAVDRDLTQTGRRT